MLILSRKINDKIIVGDMEVVIKVISINPTTVRIGIEAPEGVSIHREEIYEKIKKEMEDASKS